MAQPLPAPGWYRDPTGMGDARYWNGAIWTPSITRAGTALSAPIDPLIATLPPLAGTEVRTFPPIATSPTVSAANGDPSPVGAIVGVVVVALLVVLIAVLVSNNNSAQDTPVPSDPPATAPPATEPPATEPPATEPPADGG